VGDRPDADLPSVGHAAPVLPITEPLARERAVASCLTMLGVQRLFAHQICAPARHDEELIEGRLDGTRGLAVIN